MIVMFSYMRRAMMMQALSAFVPENVHIIDDGSTFTIKSPYFHQLPHKGKIKFWQNWQYAIDLCKASSDDLFIFTSDDVLNVDLDRIKTLHDRHKAKPYAYHLQNDGRTKQWTAVEPQPSECGEALRVGWVDCLFFCNRATLELLNWTVEPVKPIWFFKHGSSGVGANLSRAMVKAGVEIYLPFKSIGYHGDHPSMMHPGERKRNPLISK